jgi:hypothetical protein
MADSAEEEDDSRALGFRDPPESVTQPCLVYMARVTEIRSFIGFYFNFVKASDYIGKRLEALGDRESVSEEGPLRRVVYNFSRHRQLVNEIMLSRAVESFDLYVVTMMRDLFLAKPEMMKSEGTIDVSAVIESGSYDEIVYRIADRKIHELSYKSLADLRKFIVSRTGVDLFGEESFDMTLAASETRNLIAHNDCVVNDLFRAKTRGCRSLPKESSTGKLVIADDWLRRISYALDGVVFDFDVAVSAKFNLPTRNHNEAFKPRGNEIVLEG